MSSALPQIEAAKIIACTVSRDVQNFDLLIEDMEDALGESWGDLGFGEALAFFGQAEAQSLELIALAMDAQDEDNLVLMGEIITQAKARGINVILIAEDMTPVSLHSLLRQGADEFVPYPLPEGELRAAIERLRAHPENAPVADRPVMPTLKPGAEKDGAVIVVHGLAGGTGATTMAVFWLGNLPLATRRTRPKCVCWIWICNLARWRHSLICPAAKSSMICCRKPKPWTRKPLARRC